VCVCVTDRQTEGRRGEIRIFANCGQPVGAETLGDESLNAFLRFLSDTETNQADTLRDIRLNRQVREFASLSCVFLIFLLPFFPTE
jgi:hypothetical protein